MSGRSAFASRKSSVRFAEGIAAQDKEGGSPPCIVGRAKQIADQGAVGGPARHGRPIPHGDRGDDVSNRSPTQLATYISWLPNYRQTTRHLSILNSGIYTVIPFLISTVVGIGAR